MATQLINWHTPILIVLNGLLLTRQWQLSIYIGDRTCFLSGIASEPACEMCRLLRHACLCRLLHHACVCRLFSLHACVGSNFLCICVGCFVCMCVGCFHLHCVHKRLFNCMTMVGCFDLLSTSIKICCYHSPIYREGHAIFPSLITWSVYPDFDSCHTLILCPIDWYLVLDTGL